MAIKQKRDRGLKIMMTETTFNRLNELGELLGQSPSTLASLAVSNFINQYMGQEKIQTGIVAGFEKVMTKFAENAQEVAQ
jgi:hypothetical protein